MKKFFTLILFAVSTVVANAQVTEVWKDGVMQANVMAADSIRLTNNVLTREGIQAWAKEHVDSLAHVAWQTVLASDNKNTRDPDQDREVFRSIGYNGRNVYEFLLGGDVVDKAILDSLIAKAKAEGNNKVVVVAGHSGAGKSTAIRKTEAVKQITTDAGIVLDEVWTDRALLKSTLENLKNQGFTDQTVILVYNDAETSFNNACDRFLRTRRAIGLNFFIGDYLFRTYQGYVSDFMEKDLKEMGVKRIYLDNAGNNTKGAVDATAAAQWDYTLSDEKMHRMAYNLYEYIYKNKDLIGFRDAWAMFYDE